MDFLQKHPTPWVLRPRTDTEFNASYQAIVDANGREVIATLDGERYYSWFLGDVLELIDWVNTLGGED